MAPFDQPEGVWKSGKGKGRRTPKGRQVDDAAWADVQRLLGDKPRRADLLIEQLNETNDRLASLESRMVTLMAIIEQSHGSR